MKSHQRSLSQEEIIDFAQAFDPQPYHMDAAAGDASIFGGLCASGWQVAAVATQLASDTLAAEGYNPVMLTEVSEMKWRKPTFVDQSLTTELQLGERQPSSMVPGCESQGVEISVFGPESVLVAEISAVFAVDTSQ
ncbi:MAG: MaoC/PaaZ C-terminal domain-containing protein [Halieaceae bacterium]|jgi:acyl dehydratase